MVFLFRRVEFFISRWSNAYSIESLGLSIQTTQVQYSKALCQAGNIVLPSPNITSSKRLWNPFCIVFVSSRLARFAPTKSGLWKLCFAWCVLWKNYGLSCVWAHYHFINFYGSLSLEVQGSGHLTCLLGIILFSLELQGSGHLTCGFSFHLPTATRHLYSEN